MWSFVAHACVFVLFSAGFDAMLKPLSCVCGIINRGDGVGLSHFISKSFQVFL